MSVRDEIAKNIMYYRKKNNLKQEELANMVDVKKSAVSNWENGRNSVDIDTLIKISKIFKVPLSTMFGVYGDTERKFNDLSSDEKRLIEIYRTLTDKGKQYALHSLEVIATGYNIARQEVKEDTETG